MYPNLDSSTMQTNDFLVLICLILASVRIYIEVCGVDLTELPLAKSITHKIGKERVKAFHRTGLYLSTGYIILFAPQYLMH